MAGSDLRSLASCALAAIIDLQERCGAEPYARLCDELRAAGKTPPILSEAAIAWLSRGERGASSETIFTTLIGVDALRGTAASHPADANAFGRCRKLVEACPEVAENIAAMRFISPAWRALIDQWEPLCALMDEEAPNWRLHRGMAPRTFARIREILSSVAGGTS